MTEPLRVLMVEDSTTDVKLIVRELERAGHTLEWVRVETAADMRDALARAHWDLIISDWTLPTFNAPMALAIVKELKLQTPFIIVSGSVSEELTVDAMRAGANDYVLKDRLARLSPAVERELRDVKTRVAHEAALLHTQERLLQSQKMEAIGSLAGGVAHDFNNLLTVILSYSRILLEQLQSNDPMRELLNEIEHAGRRAADLTRQLLAFSRRQVLQPQVVDLNDVVTSVEKMLRRLIGEDIELVTVCSPKLGRVLVDPGQIEQVIVNLAVNSRDAMPDGGRLTIETSNVVIDEALATEHANMAPGPYVMLAVTDTGVGMDKATQARIFEPFFTTKETGKGTGLGLATVFGIVQQSSGSVWVYSELGKGTTFKCYFPRASDAASDAAVATPPSSAVPMGSETILLVEDEVQVRTLINKLLRRQGYNVLEAQSGGDALLICEQHPATIHLLLTDVVMPRMSGRQLADRLKAIRPEMKVLYMSGYTDNAVILHGVLDSGIEFLQKPITPSALASKVRQVLSRPVVPGE